MAPWRWRTAAATPCAAPRPEAVAAKPPEDGGAKPPEDGGAKPPEDEHERLNRNIAELLQELRVAGLGVQVLFGFMLALPFSSRFSAMDRWERRLYLAVLVVAAVAIVLLGGPVALHRLLFRHHARAEVVWASNIMAIAGLVAVALAVTGAVLLVARVVTAGSAAASVTAVVGVSFATAWFVLPLYVRLRGPR